MSKSQKRFVLEEQAQDITEYTLLLAFVVVVSAAIFVLSGTSMTGIWDLTNNNLNRGMASASS